MSDGSSLFHAIPENKDAPCNICGRGWPYHEDACAYKQTAAENVRLRNALRDARSVCETLPGKVTYGNGEGALTEIQWLAARLADV